MADVSNRRREPKGTPEGGRFADENKSRSNASDLDEQAFGNPTAIPDPHRLEDTADTREALLDIAQTMHSWDGSCDWADAWDPEELFSALGYDDPLDALNLIDAVANGHYDPTRDYVRFNDSGNVESVNEDDLEDQAETEADDIIQGLRDTPEVRDSLDEETLQGVKEQEPDALLWAAKELNSWDGSFEWANVYDDVNAMTDMYATADHPDHDAQWLVNRAFYGSYKPGKDLIRFDGYENFESLDETDLLQDAWDYRSEILEAARENSDADIEDPLERLDTIKEP